MHFHIRWRRALPFLILLVMAIVVVMAASVRTIRQSEMARWEAHWLDLAQLVAFEAKSYYGSPGETENLSRIASHYSENLGGTIIFLNRDSDVIAASSLDAPTAPVFDPVTISQVLSEGRTVGVADNLIIATTIVPGADEAVLGFVQLQVHLAAFRLDLSHLWNVTAITLLVSLLIGILMAAIIQDYFLNDIESLTIATQQMSSGNFHQLEFPDAPQELFDLSQSLKTMAQQLGDQIDALTSERAKLSAVLNQMTDGVLIADPSGRVQLLNPAAERIFQINNKMGLGRSVVEVLRYHQLVDLWRLAREGQRQTTMIEIGPQHLFLQVTGMPLQTSLKGSALILIQDLTQLRRLETVRRDFISNVSHELRSPLASLKALAETLQEGALEDPPAARRFIIRMETEIDNLTQLVNELLELSRIESGKVPLSFHRSHPCDLLRPAFERMSLQVERAGLIMVMDCPPDLPPVFADPDRITQVMINLVHNATKFSPPGGQITLSAYRDGDFIVFFVKDTGVGIPQKDLGRIFERFYKADRARSGGGTGLGLSIARHMVESHGGFIWAESEEDKGSIFSFSLPIA
jgi:two-component system, OmpR family, phosphate regulon sensor histidine kinase PhoR